MHCNLGFQTILDFVGLLLQYEDNIIVYIIHTCKYISISISGYIEGWIGWTYLDVGKDTSRDSPIDQEERVRSVSFHISGDRSFEIYRNGYE